MGIDQGVQASRSLNKAGKSIAENEVDIASLIGGTTAEILQNKLSPATYNKALVTLLAGRILDSGREIIDQNTLALQPRKLLVLGKFLVNKTLKTELDTYGTHRELSEYDKETNPIKLSNWSTAIQEKATFFPSELSCFLEKYHEELSNSKIGMEALDVAGRIVQEFKSIKTYVEENPKFDSSKVMGRSAEKLIPTDFELPAFLGKEIASKLKEELPESDYRKLRVVVVAEKLIEASREVIEENTLSVQFRKMPQFAKFLSNIAVGSELYVNPSHSQLKAYDAEVLFKINSDWRKILNPDFSPEDSGEHIEKAYQELKSNVHGKKYVDFVERLYEIREIPSHIDRSTPLP